ncbi:hypothetical protein [Enterobacter soli]|uniref:hypothetical protein n=1 Tax=Enterobacter soli TaxID=885040 RepID=UPI0037368FA3
MAGRAGLRHHPPRACSMTAAERWDEESFLRLVRDVLPEEPESDDEPVNLAAERQNPVISWDEFTGNYT